ncbi:hypothetical protein GGF43_005298 [Coemansia sp. RSA 2618]|nr:hypothetical protein GGF43_005298 [Coemansia sp. RSA 2618]
MGDILNIFEHRKYTVASSRQSDGSQSTPKRQASGFLSSSSISLISSPVSPSPPTSPLRPKNAAKSVQWNSPTKPGRRTPSSTNRRAPDVALEDTLLSMKKAQKLAARDPAVAATVLWKIAKDLAAHSQQRDNLRLAVETTQQCLHQMVDRPDLRGAKGSAAVWSARSLLKTTLECDLAAARLLWVIDRRNAAAQYLSALCRYMGIETSVVAAFANTHDFGEMCTQAARVAKSVPRKFAKPEDLSQALDALEEAASAQLASVSSEPTALAVKLGLAVCLLRHAFAMERQMPDMAYRTVLSTIASLHALGLRYLASECASLIMDHHMSQPDARMQVAASVVSSLKESDLVRAHALLQSYNYRFEEPWSRFMATVVDKAVDADIRWMSDCAMNEWRDVMLDSTTNNEPIYELIQATLATYLEPYIWYMPGE